MVLESIDTQQTMRGKNLVFLAILPLHSLVKMAQNGHFYFFSKSSQLAMVLTCFLFCFVFLVFVLFFCFCFFLRRANRRWFQGPQMYTRRNLVPRAFLRQREGGRGKTLACIG